MASDNSLANLQNRNIPIQSDVIVPKEELLHRPIFIEAHLKKKDAIQRYGTYGRCISFSDVIREFRCSKAKAQCILKDCCRQGIG